MFDKIAFREQVYAAEVNLIDSIKSVDAFSRITRKFLRKVQEKMPDTLIEDFENAAFNFPRALDGEHEKFLLCKLSVLYRTRMIGLLHLAALPTLAEGEERKKVAELIRKTVHSTIEDVAQHIGGIEYMTGEMEKQQSREIDAAREELEEEICGSIQALAEDVMP